MSLTTGPDLCIFRPKCNPAKGFARKLNRVAQSDPVAASEGQRDLIVGSMYGLNN